MELERADREFIALALYGANRLSDIYGASYCGHNARTHAGLGVDRVNRLSPHILDLLRRAARSIAHGQYGLALKLAMVEAARNADDAPGDPPITDELLERLAVRWLAGALQGSTTRQLDAAQFLTRLFQSSV